MSVASVVYFAIVAGTWPTFTRYRYRQRRRRHPQTHERDVYVDVLHALTEGALCAVLWLPIVVSRYTLRAGWWTARIVLGRSFRADLTAARTARLEAELAAMDAAGEPANVIRLDRRPSSSYVIDARRADELRTLIREAEELKQAITDADRLGATGHAAELRAALKVRLDAMHDVAARLTVAQ